MCGGVGASVSARAEQLYQEKKKNYGDLPSLAMGDKVERGEDGMEDISKKKKKGGNSDDSTARSLLMPYAK